MSDVTRARRVLEGKCAEPGCTNDVRGRRRRCPEHEREHAEDQQNLRDKRVEAGLCPRCGKKPPDETAKSCFNCGFGVEEGDDYVGAILKHDRLWQKKLAEDG
jgi:ribosomal protein L37E